MRRHPELAQRIAYHACQAQYGEPDVPPCEQILREAASYEGKPADSCTQQEPERQANCYETIELTRDIRVPQFVNGMLQLTDADGNLYSDQDD